MTEAATIENKSETKADDIGTVEDQAKRMGWSPKDEFRGAPEKWTDAQTFVKNGLESLPILRERNRTLQKNVDDLTKSVGEFKKMSDTAYDRAYEKAKKDLKAEIKTAGKEGDEKAVEAATDELAKLEREKAERGAATAADPVFDSWVSENAWYKDPDLAIEAEAEALKLRKRGDKSDGLSFLEKVKEKVKERFPEKFGNARRQAGSGVERPSAGGDGGNGAAKGWETLPADAKAAGERYIKQKLYKDKAAYAAAYHSQN